MARQARAKPSAAFDAALMERFWTLENEFLSAFGKSEADLSIRRNRLLLCAVLFGGLLDPESWPDWISSVMGKLRILPTGGRLNAQHTHAVFISSKGRKWFADPMTQNLLGRPVGIKTGDSVAEGLTLSGSDYVRIIGLGEEQFIEELKSWVLPAAQIKMSLIWPPLIVEHCSGSLNSTSLSKDRWSQLDKQDAKQLGPVGKLEPIRSERPSQETGKAKYQWFEDDGFHFIREAIQMAIEYYAASDDPTLALERAALQEALEYSQGYREPETLGWWVHKWFLQYCPDRPLEEGQRPRHQRARTLYDNVFKLGVSVDWGNDWLAPLEYVPPQTIEHKLHAAVMSRPDGFGAARRLYSFLGFGTLSRPAGLRGEQRTANIKNQILSKPEFEAMLTQLHDQSGQRGAHWLAAMLMFRCGLRPREIVAMEVDQITIVDAIVELKVAATPYVALKNKTSGRVLPLHALLSADELAKLLKWRAGRIRDCGRKRRHARLLFATVYHPSDYDYLFDPIERAIRKACGQQEPTDKERKTAAYTFSRCSVLRHSFVSYAVATMLFPRDDDGFQLPPGITPDFVSLARRERLERVLLSEGHLGLSSLEAVRQLTGHAKFQRTIGTYTHLMDLVAGAYCWRRSSEPSIPAEVLCQLAPDKVMPDTLSHYARKESAAEQSAVETAIQALHSEQEVLHLLPPRPRRPRGKTFPAWMPQGNAFLSQLRSGLPPAAVEDTLELPEWRRDEVADWHTLDQIVQMASRGIPARLIADELGVRVVHVERLACRYHQLLSLRKRATARGIGKHRHAIVLEKPKASIGAFDADNGCWYEPLKHLPSSRDEWIDAFWDKLQGLREQPAKLSLARTFLRKHQDGRVQAKSLRDKINSELRSWPSGRDNSRWDLLNFRIKASDRRKSRFRFKGEGLLSKKRRKKTKALLENSVLVHLLLLAEVASSTELPEALVTTPAASLGTDVTAKISAYREEQDRKQKEAAEEARRLARKAQQAKDAASEKRRREKKKQRRELEAKQKLGLGTVNSAVKPPRTSNEDRQTKIARMREFKRRMWRI